jgi:hypothetical protein
MKIALLLTTLVLALGSALVAVPASAALAWDIQTVDSDGDTGYYSSMAVDRSGNPHVGYMLSGWRTRAWTHTREPQPIWSAASPLTARVFWMKQRNISCMPSIPWHPGAAFWLGSVYSDMGKHDKAAHYQAEALSLCESGGFAPWLEVAGTALSGPG